MTDRISIPALRRQVENVHESSVVFLPREALALVEAVEAARKHVEGCHQSLDLEVYLARFDFGEDT